MNVYNSPVGTPIHSSPICPLEGESVSVERKANTLRGWLADVGLMYVIVVLLVVASFLLVAVFTAVSCDSTASEPVRSGPGPNYPGSP